MSRMVGGTFGVAAMGALITGLGRAEDRRPAARGCPSRARRSWPTRSARAARRSAARSATPSTRPSSTRSTTACASAPPSPLLGALLAWMLIADAPSAPAEVAATERPRPRAPRPRRRWPRSVCRPLTCPAPPIASAAPDAGPRPRRRCDAIRALHERGEFFWLDLDSPSDADLDALGELLEHPRPRRSRTAKEFGQRPKLDDYGDARADRLLRRARRASSSSRSTSTSRRSEVVTVRRSPCAHLGRRASARPRRRCAPSRTSSTASSTRWRTRCARSPTATRREVERLEEIAFERPEPADRRRMSELRSEPVPPAAGRRPAARHARPAAASCSSACPGLERDVGAPPVPRRPRRPRA